MSKIIKSLIFILIGMGIATVMIAVSVLFVALAFSTPQVTVKNNSWLVLDFAGVIREKPGSPVSLGTISGREMSLYQLLGSIYQARYDKNIKGLLINGDMTFYSRVHIEEIHKAVEDFKESGKPVKAWFSNGVNRNYNLCLSADEIYMPPTDAAGLMLRGYSATIPYLKDGLQKIGVEFTVIHVGDYKGAGENYTRTSMSEELRSNQKGLYDSIHQSGLDYLAERRGVSKRRVEKLLQSGDSLFLTPGQCIDNGLIDGTKNWNEMIYDSSSDRTDNTISIITYSAQLASSNNSKKIAVVHVEGAITNYFSGEDRMWGSVTGAKSFIEDIEAIADSKKIEAVILRVNSPGGSALGSELMLQALMKIKEKKPVYVSMGSVAASGGYYISLAGERVFASPYTITGSIGVVSMLMNYEGLTGKIGVNFETIKKYPYDDAFSPYRKPTESEKAQLSNSMKGIYREFTAHVINKRNIDPTAIRDIAEGRVWSGNQALENGLIDEIGGLVDTLTYVREANGLEKSGIITFPRPPGLMESIMSQVNTSSSYPAVAELIPEQILHVIGFCRENGIRPALLLPFYDEI
jgi:protease-4